MNCKTGVAQAGFVKPSAAGFGSGGTHVTLV